MVSGAGSKSSTAAESDRTTSEEKRKSSDERVFAVVSTPRSSAPAAAADAAEKRHPDHESEARPGAMLQPTSVHRTHQQPSVTGGQTSTRSREDQEDSVVDKQEQPAIEVDRKAAAEPSVSEPVFGKAAPVSVSRTDPAHLHKLVSHRIEQSLSSKQEESTVTTTHQVKTQYILHRRNNVQLRKF